MMKGQSHALSDDLIADSLQIENYLNQVKTSRLETVRLGVEEVISSYLKRYSLASPEVQFQIFLFSTFYGEKVERYLKGG